ncbi:G2/mitotic-specific cyclin-B3 isoform X2 [Hyalella azteca]|uniref:G2/mitotic-specific cyclin-B3 isoform X2 n=2 Tax=Hyalella azteca TaxID=294128 RepID=A0A8B7MZX1_HYAAZ|nr:G2/mitotic-specific cyclin-B3 isoform X2 [Hyalella azteca]
MTSRGNMRSTRSSTIGQATINKNKSLAILGFNGNNENLLRPPLPSKTGFTRGGGLKDAGNKQFTSVGVKRKADTSIESATTKKRSVLGDVTNAIEKTINQGRKEVQKLGLQKKSRVDSALCRPTASTLAKQVTQVPAKSKTLPHTIGKLASVTSLPKAQNVDAAAKILKNAAVVRSESCSLANVQKSKLDRGGNAPLASEEEDELSEGDSMPCAAIEQRLTLDSSNYVTASEASPIRSARCAESALTSVAEEDLSEDFRKIPAGVVDYDKECEMDPFAVALYAHDIFQYYKQREAKFQIDKYLSRQSQVTESMRSILVDWMVEVQESFELNHETLYLAVKLVDLHLSKTVISRDQLQLVGSTALFVACKFDERVSPYVDDFLYICDDAYKRKELLAYEIKLLKSVGYDLGIPLSYRYLRRYARCAKVSMEQLTLSRYILELSLMEYQLIDASDSALAAAALLLARYITQRREMPEQDKNELPDIIWNKTLEHYSGFRMSEVYHLAQVLHTMLTQPPKEHLKTVRNKYNHEVFYEVAKIPVPETLDL